ncbi:hypothetical protein [Novosphingobium beihaiensis]|uniref:Lycopene cyclase domain-containing protein n=1 Tax=Novosphingobium beihaiensis TaxID=2930389 RepID=A0ABT0BKB2_9SPHN|nr:hypothetical protein [Novosphingobium beihaiensis]MCJ2185266.1 hypothetical protein [Novosphingobium beihaiensis]
MPVYFLEALAVLLVVGPVTDLARYLPFHNFSTEGWTYWPLGDWFAGRFDFLSIFFLAGLSLLIAAIRRAASKELFDE